MQWMVTFTFEPELIQSFMDRIPDQRALVNQYFVEGKLAQYTLSLPKGMLWAIFNARDESELIAWVTEMPLTPEMEWEIHPLTFNQGVISQTLSFSNN